MGKYDAYSKMYLSANNTDADDRYHDHICGWINTNNYNSRGRVNVLLHLHVYIDAIYNNRQEDITSICNNYSIGIPIHVYPMNTNTQMVSSVV